MHRPSLLAGLLLAPASLLAPVHAQEICASARLTAEGACDHDHLEFTMAVDGRWVFLGVDAPGHVLVYRREAGGWSLHQDLGPRTPGLHPHFGSQIAAGGGLLVVGEVQAWNWNGRVWVPLGGRLHLYELDPGTGLWTPSARLRPKDLRPHGPLHDPMIDTDGRTVVLGQHDGNGFPARWRLDVFERTDGGWEDHVVPKPPDRRTFGLRPRVSGTHLLAIEWSRYGWPFVGAYERTTTGWEWVGRLRLPEISKVVGRLDLDGGLAAVPWGDQSFDPHHEVRLFRWDGDAWRTEADLAGIGPWGFGLVPRAALSQERVLLGDPAHDDHPFCPTEDCYAGAAFLVQRQANGTWSGRRLTHPDPAQHDLFGDRVAMDGDTLLIEAPLDSDSFVTDGVLGFRVPRLDRHCDATPNSTGPSARIDLEGCASIQENAATLVAQPVPDTPGLFVHGPEADRTPFGPGYACVGAPLRRLPRCGVEGAAGAKRVEAYLDTGLEVGLVLQRDRDAVGEVARGLRVHVAEPGLEGPGFAGRAGDRPPRLRDRGQVDRYRDRSGGPRVLHLGCVAADGTAETQRALASAHSGDVVLRHGYEEVTELVRREHVRRQAELVLGDGRAAGGHDRGRRTGGVELGG